MNKPLSVAAPDKPNIAPCEIWNNWNNARNSQSGRAAISLYEITCSELTDWPNTHAVRQGEIDLVLRPYARQHR